MTQRVDLIATRAMTYSTRRLQADDLFQASRRDGRLLVAIGKARFADPAEQPATKPAPAAPPKKRGRAPSRAKPKAG